MTRHPLRLLAAALLLLPALSAEDPIRDGFSSRYTLDYNSLEIGVTERTLIPLGDGTVVFKSQAYPTGLAAMLISDRVVERSVIDLENSALRPVEYSYRQSGGSKDRHSEVYFAWPRGELIIRPANSRLPLAPGTLDALSFQLALMRDLAAGKREFTYRIADRRRVREYRFEVKGTERVETPFGRFDAVHVAAINAEQDQSFEFWCAPELSYLPVRLVHQDEGDTTRLSLTSYTPQ